MKTKNLLLVLVLATMTLPLWGETLQERLETLKTSEKTVAADAFRKEIRLRTGLRQGLGAGDALRNGGRAGEFRGSGLHLERQKYREEGSSGQGRNGKTTPGRPDGMGR